MAVTFDGTRITDADALSPATPVAGVWEDIGGGAAVLEGDFVYQGTNSISEKVKTTEFGVCFIPNATTYDVTDGKVFIYKGIATTSGILDTTPAVGFKFEIGSGATAGAGKPSNYVQFYMYTNTTYPSKGGWLIEPIDPNITGYRDNIVGTLSYTAINYWATVATYTASSKSENTAMDAIDFINVGEGLTWVGSNGDFQEFVDFDEGTINNRYGLVTTVTGILYVFGILTIGTSILTTFSDSNKTLVFPNGRFGTGFSGIRVGLQNASNDITFTSCSFIGGGVYGNDGETGPNAEDTRPVFYVLGQSGVLLIDACSFINFNEFSFNSGVTLQDSTFVDPYLLIPSGASITRSTFDSPALSAFEVFLPTDDIETITYCDFISNGFGHAIELTASGDGSLNFIGNTFSIYPSADGNTGNEALYNNSGGNVTINLIDTTSIPSVRNGVGSNTTVQLSVTLTLTGIVSGSEVRIQQARGSAPSGTELFHVETTDGTDVDWTYNFSDFGAAYFIDIIVHNLTYDYLRIDNVNLPDSDTSIPIQQRKDRWYENI